MANDLQVTQPQQAIALLELGWGYRRIQAETGDSLSDGESETPTTITC
jgi:hypothetical protein